jgi:hypothetical protein
MLNGGDGTNTELVFTPLCLAGAVIIFGTEKSEGRGLFVRGLCGGLLLGTAVQVKYIAIFDIAALASMYLVTQLPRFGSTKWRKLAVLVPTTALGIAIPTLLVFAWYFAIGRADALISSNIVANEALVGETAPAFNVQGLIDGLRAYDVPALSALAAVAFGWIFAKSPEQKREWIAIVIWLFWMSLALLFLRRFADHFFIETLPALSMATAWIAFRVFKTMRLGEVPARVALIACAILLAAWSNRSEFSAAVETVAKRNQGVAFWGDRSATVAAALRNRLGASDEIYVFGRTLGVYDAAGRKPPTRFPFTEHLWEPYSPSNGVSEITRIMDRRPAFIIVDDLWLPDAKAIEPDRVPVTRVLAATVARDYVVDGKVSKFVSWGGGFIGGGIGVTVFRRRDVASFQPTAALQYVPRN